MMLKRFHSLTGYLVGFTLGNIIFCLVPLFLSHYVFDSSQFSLVVFFLDYLVFFLAPMVFGLASILCVRKLKMKGIIAFEISIVGGAFFVGYLPGVTPCGSIEAGCETFFLMTAECLAFACYVLLCYMGMVLRDKLQTFTFRINPFLRLVLSLLYGVVVVSCLYRFTLFPGKIDTFTSLLVGTVVAAEMFCHFFSLSENIENIFSSVKGRILWFTVLLVAHIGIILSANQVFDSKDSIFNDSGRELSSLAFLPISIVVVAFLGTKPVRRKLRLQRDISYRSSDHTVLPNF